MAREKGLLRDDFLQEVLFGSSDSSHSRRLSHLVGKGKIRKIGPKLYTANLKDSAQEIVRRNLYPILSHYFPGAVVSHRTAFDGRPSKEGVVFLTYHYTKRITLPGIVIRLLQGRGPQPDDMPFVGSLFIASQAPVMLENLEPSRRIDGVSKAVGQIEIESRLDQICRIQGEAELQKIRDQARKLSHSLGLQNTFKKLDGIIGATLGTRDVSHLRSPLSRARAVRHPYDPDRLVVFENLFGTLRGQVFPSRRGLMPGRLSWRVQSFFEAYFSNHIEGTRFEVDEASEIVFDGMIPKNRPADAHDVLGTYRLVADHREIGKIPFDSGDFLKILKYRHQMLMVRRPEMNPGLFKTIRNRAGSTFFVDPGLVLGTLEKGFEIYRALPVGFSRAVFMMFLVSEVHPFLDGNGRIARIMMNAELVAKTQCKILIPPVLREDYLLALRLLSRKANPKSLIVFMCKAQAFSESISYASLPIARKAFESANAFVEPHEGKLKFVL